MYPHSSENLVSVKKPVMHAGLFDKIIFTIRREQEFKNTKRILLLFFGLLVISVICAPITWTILAEQIKSSGISYFISMAVNDFGSVIKVWKYFGLAIVDSLPIAGIIVFAINIALVPFTIRLFLHKKQYLFRYLLHNFKLIN